MHRGETENEIEDLQKLSFYFQITFSGLRRSAGLEWSQSDDSLDLSSPQIDSKKVIGQTHNFIFSDWPLLL